MPVEIKKYTCEFKCGKKAVGDKGRMAAHESFCWKNPDNKTCKTCSNEIYGIDIDENTNTGYRSCKISVIGNVLESVEDILNNQQTVHLRPVYKCPLWKELVVSLV